MVQTQPKWSKSIIIVQLNIDYPTTSGQTTVRRCSDKANVPDKKKLTLSVVITSFTYDTTCLHAYVRKSNMSSRTTFLLFKIFVFFEWLTTCTVRTLRHVRPKKLLRIIEWSDSRCADNRCSTVLTGLRERDKREKSEEKIDCHHQDSNQGPSLVASCIDYN